MSEANYGTRSKLLVYNVYKKCFLCYLNRISVLLTYLNKYFEFQLPFWIYNDEIRLRACFNQKGVSR